MGAALVGAFLLIELRLDGHSIGSPKQRPRPRPRTVVALEYYKAHSEHVSALVFGGSVFDWRANAREAEAWTKQMSDSGQRAIVQWKKDGIDTSRSFKFVTVSQNKTLPFRRIPDSHFTGDLAHKDLTLLVDAAKAAKVPMPAGAIAREAYSVARAGIWRQRLFGDG